MKLSQAAKAAGIKAKPKRKAPLWAGPTDPKGGVTQGLIGRWLVCRERTRLRLVEGLACDDGFEHRSAYGDLWHVCEEAMVTHGGKWEPALLAAAKAMVQRHGPQFSKEIEKYYQLCKRQFLCYLKYWEAHPPEHPSEALLRECEFRIPYTLPSGRWVWLRGKIDGVNYVAQGTFAGVWLQENKTKGDINEEKIRRQLSFDLQTMTYLVALRQLQRMAKDGFDLPGFDDHEHILPGPEHFGNLPISVLEPIRGVMYNVVRRPLSGGKGSIKQKEGYYRKPRNKAEREKYGEQVPVPGETNIEYWDRAAEYFVNEPETYFMRWDSLVSQREIDRFETEFLRPCLEQLCQWWDMVSTWDLFNDKAAPLNYLHWRHPHGVYNVLNEGGSTEYDEYMANGNEAGLRRLTTLFPELGTT